MRTSLACFPFVEELEVFNFAYQPSLDRNQIEALVSCHFIEGGENVVILGPPGVGKSHLAIGLGLKAIGSGYRVLFAILPLSWMAAGTEIATRHCDDGQMISGKRQTSRQAIPALSLSGHAPVPVPAHAPAGDQRSGRGRPQALHTSSIRSMVTAWC